MRLHDITETAGPTEHSPELRGRFEALGWTVLGRVRLGTEQEIHEEWTAGPHQERDARFMATFLRRKPEQRRLEADRRTTELVSEPTADSLARTHHEHVTRIAARSGTRPATHGTLPQAMDLWHQQFAPGQACFRRCTNLTFLATATVMCTVLGVALLGQWRHVTSSAPSTWVTSAAWTTALLLPMVVAAWIRPRLITPAMYVRRFKPPFRGMVWPSA